MILTRRGSQISQVATQKSGSPTFATSNRLHFSAALNHLLLTEGQREGRLLQAVQGNCRREEKGGPCGRCCIDVGFSTVFSNDDHIVKWHRQLFFPGQHCFVLPLSDLT